MSIIPLGFGRTSVSSQVNRSLMSLQSQNATMAKYEQQLTTQLRYQYGSDAPFDAATTQSVQIQMERKEQNAKNVSSALSFLSATDSAVSKVNTLMTDARGAALDAINTTTSTTQRSALAMTVQQTILQVFNLGNTQYNSRYLFSGATTDKIPFAWGNDSYTIDYLGTQNNLSTWTNTDLLAKSNVNGVEIFGAISEPIRGMNDLNPALRYDTPLAELNSGDGVTLGSIRLTFSRNGVATTSDVDLVGSVTVSDVCERIAAASPSGITIRVERTDSGLAITLPADAPVSLMITEVGRETVAKQLGIFSPTPIKPGDTFYGRDLAPVVSRQTPLADLFGSRAIASLKFAGSNNDILVEASSNGDEWNGIGVDLFGDRNVLPGQEIVTYDAASRRVTVTMHPDNTSASNIVDSINLAAENGTIPPLTARLDPLDQENRGNTTPGSGLIPILPGTAIPVGTTKYGTGENFDKDSGMQIVNGNRTHTINLSECVTVGDMLSVLNAPQYGLVASVNASRSGIDIQSRVSGADFTISENGGTTATQLGVRTLRGQTPLSDLDFGRGVNDYEGPGTNAGVTIISPTPNSGVRLTAKEEGTHWNNVEVNFVKTDDPDGKVLVTWDETIPSITVAINPGVTRACDVVAAFNEQPGAREFFDIALDDTAGINTGEGSVGLGEWLTAGGSDGGIDFTITRHDGTQLEINIRGAKTIDDVLRIINNHEKNTDGFLVARLSKFGNGIELIDTSVGGRATRVDRALLSTAAIELGLVPRGSESQEATSLGSMASVMTKSAQLNSTLFVSGAAVGSYANGVQVEIVDMNAVGGSGQPTFSWNAATGVLRFEIDPAITTANNILQLFESQASPQVKSLFRFQNGSNPDGTTSDGSGLVSLGTSVLAGGDDTVITGSDPNPLETESLYTALIRMQVAMEKNDVREIERAAQMLDKCVNTLTNVRAEVGVRQQALDMTADRLDDEYIEFRSTLKNSHEIDVTETSLAYMGQQVAYQAALTVAGRMFQLSLLNYL